MMSVNKTNYKINKLNPYFTNFIIIEKIFTVSYED